MLYSCRGALTFIQRSHSIQRRNQTSEIQEKKDRWDQCLCMRHGRLVPYCSKNRSRAAPARRTPELYGAYAEYDTYMNGELIAVSEQLTVGRHRIRIALKPPGEPVGVYTLPHSMKPLPGLIETNESERQREKTTQEGTSSVGQRNIRQGGDGSRRQLTGQCHRFWIPGSTPLALANIARGRIKVVIAQTQPVWDVAPGFALVREAGGKATLWSGKEQLDVSGNSTKNILASNGLLHEQVRGHVSRAS